GLFNFISVYEFLLNSLSLSMMSLTLSIDYKSLKRIYRKMNENVKARFFESLEPIVGEGVIVEIDESKFGKRKYHRGHRVEGVWVFGMMERFGDRRIILVPIENRNAEN
ncbi:hypothetical protein DMUE_2243, partial [Dictyocoela muelleri]